MSELRFRPAAFDDMRLVFDWANDPDTRANSARTEPIPWEEHLAWYQEKLADPDAEIWIALDDQGQPAGQVRFDVAGAEAEIGVIVARTRRGHGLGTRMIERSTADFRQRHPEVTVRAYIRHANVASQQAFEKAGYEPDGEGEARGVTMLRYVHPGASA